VDAIWIPLGKSCQERNQEEIKQQMGHVDNGMDNEENDKEEDQERYEDTKDE